MSTHQKSEVMSVITRGVPLLKRLRAYAPILFVVFIACLYGFLIMRVSSLNSVEPSQASIDKQVQAAKVPKLDDEVVRQLQSLQDNSVSVQTLFNEARSNPFQE